MRYRYLDDFRRGISVFAIFSYGIAVLGTPQCPPQEEKCKKTTQLLSRHNSVTAAVSKGQTTSQALTELASPADILRRASRFPSPRRNA